jgi:hypothetical protein
MRLSKKLIVIGVAITAASAVVAPCSAAGKAFTASSQVALNFQLIQKSGLTRVYQLPQGAAYWAPALPIVHGDRLNADVSLVGGDDKINQSDALVDGKKVCTLTQPRYSRPDCRPCCSRGPSKLRPRYRFPIACTISAADCR